MREHPVDNDIRNFWKSFPLRIPGHSISPCHREPTLLVQSMEGGFVTRNCPTCSRNETLPKAVFLNELELWVACPKCKVRMNPGYDPRGNYAYICDACDLYIKLASL